jgi:hypothetical protein
MANEEQLAILRQGVEVWNQWRKENPYALVDLSRANLIQAILAGADLSRAILITANLTGANLIAADLAGANLIAANFTGADLTKADLSSADIRGANLTGADLSGADLYAVQALLTNFSETRLTGTCIQDWNINSETKFDHVICKHVYLEKIYVDKNSKRYSDRIPVDRDFYPGEFTKRFRVTTEIIELVFNDRIEWEAFSYSLNKLKAEHPDSQIEVSGLNNRNGLIYVNITVSPNLDKQALEAEFFKGYEFAEKKLAQYYQNRLDDKDAEISRKDAQIDRLIEKASNSRTQTIIIGNDMNLKADGANVAIGDMSGHIQNQVTGQNPEE